jgi:hypothetical protein
LLDLIEEADIEAVKAGVVETFSGLSSSIWNVLIRHREGHQDTLSRIARLDNEAELCKVETHKRQILKLSKENGLLRQTIAELNEQITLLNEKI